MRRLALLVAGLLAALGAGAVLAVFTTGDSSSAKAAGCRCTVTFPVTTTVPGPTTTVVQTVTETVTEPTSTATETVPVWSADMETGDFSQWSNGAAPGWDSNCQEKAVVADGHAQSGSYAIRMTVDTRTGTAGCRQPQLPEIQTGGTYIYEASYFLPQPTLTVANHWNVFQFKSKSSATVSGSDPIWTIDFQGDPLRPVLSWKGGTYGLTGPFASDGNIGQRDYPNDLTTTPIGQWTTLKVYLDQSTAFDGAIKVWQDGTLLYDMEGVKTAYPSGIAQWSVNNYSNGLTVNPYSLYIDDVSISEP